MNNENDYIINGVVEHIIYKNSENAYTVFVLNYESASEEIKNAIGEETLEKEITCVAYIPNISEGEYLEVIGRFTKHAQYGTQFQVSKYKIEMPTTKQAIKKYLGSGIIKGIGPKLADKIVETFGEQTLMVIEEYPERLAQIKGITKKKAIQISGIFHEQSYLRQIIIFFQTYGISPVYATKIYEKYKERTIEIVKANPYILTEEIHGIGFKIADGIATSLGIPPNDPFRINAGIAFVLTMASRQGHTYLPIDSLKKLSFELLEIDVELIGNTLKEMQVNGLIFQEKIDEVICIFLASFYKAENFIARKILELASHPFNCNLKINYEMEKFQEQNGIFLADTQQEAVKTALTTGVLVLTGGPGTGKTTTINTMIHILEKDGLSIELCAPTGRAAKRMTEATGKEAKTIHRLLEIGHDGRNLYNVSSLTNANKGETKESNAKKYMKNAIADSSIIESDVVIVDECSMMDVFLMQGLLAAISVGTKLIIVGDVDQLPSVGAGNVLKDIINSDGVSVVRLTEIFRQAQESAIIMNAHRVNKGEMIEANEKNSDFFFVKTNSIDNTTSTLIDLITRRLPKFLVNAKPDDFQILTPMRKGDLGCNNLNNILQDYLNPVDVDTRQYIRGKTIFRTGDRVMQIKNNYNLAYILKDERGRNIGEGTGVFNGDMGVIKNINTSEEEILIVYDDNRHMLYNYSNMDEVELSYAVTVHKSQGSEYRAVIVPIYNGSPILLNRNLLYTAITRAKELVVLVGSMDTLMLMIENNNTAKRFSSLDLRIDKMKDMHF